MKNIKQDIESKIHDLVQTINHHGLDWIQFYKKNGYNAVEKKKGRPQKMPKKKENKNQKELSQIEKLEKEIQRLKAENAYLKYLRKNGLVDEEK